MKRSLLILLIPLWAAACSKAEIPEPETPAQEQRTVTLNFAAETSSPFGDPITTRASNVTDFRVMLFDAQGILQGYADSNGGNAASFSVTYMPNAVYSCVYMGNFLYASGEAGNTPTVGTTDALGIYSLQLASLWKNPGVKMLAVGREQIVMNSLQSGSTITAKMNLASMRFLLNLPLGMTTTNRIFYMTCYAILPTGFRYNSGYVYPSSAFTTTSRFELVNGQLTTYLPPLEPSTITIYTLGLYMTDLNGTVTGTKVVPAVSISLLPANSYTLNVLTPITLSTRNGEVEDDVVLTHDKHL